MPAPSDSASGEFNDLVRAVFKGGNVLFLGRFVDMAISFFALLVMARVLGVVDYGGVSLGVKILTVGSTLVVLGLNTGVSHYLPRHDDPAAQRGILVSAFQIALPVAVVAGVVTFLAAPWLAGSVFGDASITGVIQICALGIPFAAVFKLAIGGIQGSQRTAPRVYLKDVALPLSRFTFIGVALYFGYQSEGAATAYAASFLFVAVLGVYYLRTLTPLFSRVPATTARRELLSFSLPLLVSAAMTMIFADVDIFMLGYFSTLRSVGVYNVVYPLATLLAVVLTSFTFLFRPIMSELHSQGGLGEMTRLYQLVTRWVVIATLPLFYLVVLFPAFPIRHTFGPEYATGATALSVLALGFMFQVTVGPNVAALTSTGDTRSVMVANTAAAVANIGLNLLLIPAYSFLGAAVATTVSFVLLNVLVSLRLYREAGIHPFTGTLVSFLLATGALAVLFRWVLVAVVGATDLAILGAIGVYGLLYVAVVVRYGGFGDEEVMLVESVEERFGVDLGPLGAVVERAAGRERE